MAGMVWSTNSSGGYLSSFNLDRELRKAVRASQKFRQFADIKDAWNATRAGETFTWDTVPMITRGNRALAETSTVPQSNVTVLQGTLTISERGQAIPYTHKLERLAMIGVRAPLMRVLKYDAQCDLDALCHGQFDATPLRYVGTTSSSGTLQTASPATATNTSAFNSSHAKIIIDHMKDRNIMPFENGDYYAIARPSGYRTFKNNIESLNTYTESGITMIRNGEIGRYEGCRYIEQTSVPSGGAADTTTFSAFTDTSDPWNGAATNLSDWVFFFGEETVAEAVNTEEEIRYNIVTDYGRSKGLAWYYLGGMGLQHTTATQARIIKFDSAV